MEEKRSNLSRENKNKSLKHCCWTLLLILLLTACSRKTAPTHKVPEAGGVTGYDRESNWAALPQLDDLSDEVPGPLQAAYQKDTSVDVFFIHPTTFTGKFDGRWNASVEDADLNRKTDESTIHLQASVFNEYNVYAPRYRQAQIFSFFTEDTIARNVAVQKAYEDVRLAFIYYLKNWNKGKPIILASHSQGSHHAKLLLREFFEGKPLQHQLVASYLLGLQVEPDYFKGIPVCKDSTQTGCFVTWRTFRNGYEPPYASAFRESVVVNPLNWKADTSYAPITLHKGAVLRNFNKMFYGISDAQVYKDLLWVSRPSFPGSRLIRSKNYHIGDINLFYLNIRENLNARVREYKKISVH